MLSKLDSQWFLSIFLLKLIDFCLWHFHPSFSTMSKVSCTDFWWIIADR
jgi:hypothetical protein